MSTSMPWHRWRAVFAAALVFAATAQAQDPTTETEIDIRLEVYRAADLEVTPIDFGTVLINGDSGTLEMDSTGMLRFAGGILQVFDGPLGSAQAGTLTMDANAGATANITLDATVDLGSGVTFTPEIGSTAVAMNGGPVTVNVYGTVEFPANTQSGNYDGLLTVNVSYN